MANKDFLKNLEKNKSKIENFTNEAKKKSKSILTLYLDRTLVDLFKEKSFLFFKENGRLDKFSYSNYLIVCIENAKDYLKKEYKSLKEPDKSYMQFYSRKGNVNRLSGVDYPRINVETMTFSIGEHLDDYYKIMHTYYLNEKNNLPNYSTSFFFYDLMRICEKLGELKMFEFDD